MNPYDPNDDNSSAAAPVDCRQVSSSSLFSLSNISDKIECESVARRKLEEWGFDPNDVSKPSSQWYESSILGSSNINYGKRESRAMIIFSHLSDLPMLGYILQNSDAGELNKTDEYGLFPLYAAISKGPTEKEVLTVCQWLVRQGADVKQRVGREWSPLSRACLLGFENVALWLLSAGALLEGCTGSFHVELAKRDLPSYGYELEQVTANRIHRKIFAWAEQVVSTRSSFLLFSAGTRTRTKDGPRKSIQDTLNNIYGLHCSDAISFLLEDISEAKLAAFLQKTASPLQVLNGYPGILEQIAQYVGVETSRTILTTAHGLIQHERW